MNVVTNKDERPMILLERQAGGFESRDRIGGIVIRDAVAVMVQTGFLALEQRQPTFAGGEEAFFSRRLQAVVLPW
jgi:hypothetical protein